MEEKPSVWQVGLKVGLIIALIVIIYSTILQIAGLSQNKFLGWVSFLVLIGGIVWAHKTYKESGDGFMSYGQGLGLGVVVSGVAAVLSSIFSYIYIKFIDDSMLGLIMDQARSDMEAKGMDDDQIEQALAVTQKFMNPEMMFVMGILMFIFMGFLFSLIISAITKRNAPELQY